MLELLTSTQLSVPLLQVAMLLVLSTVALLFGRIKLALLVNYCFTLYWGYFLNLDLFIEKGGAFNMYTVGYLASGVVILLIALMSLLCHRD